MEQKYFHTTNNDVNIDKSNQKSALHCKQKKITKIITDFLRKQFNLIYPKARQIFPYFFFINLKSNKVFPSYHPGYKVY